MRLEASFREKFYNGLKFIFGAIFSILLFILAGPFVSFVVYAILQALFVASTAFLILIGYVIVSNLLATGHSMEFFSIGKFFSKYGKIYYERTFFSEDRIYSENRFAMSFLCGTLVYPFPLMNAILLGIAAVICNLLALPAFSLLLPFIAGAAVLIMVAEEVYARVWKNSFINENHIIIEEEAQAAIKRSAAFLSCDEKLSFSYAAIFYLVIIILAGYIILRALGISLFVLTIPFLIQIALAVTLFLVFTLSVIYSFSYKPSLHEMIKSPDSYSKEIGSYLREHKCALSEKNLDGFTPFQLACQQGFNKAIDLLYNNAASPEQEVELVLDAVRFSEKSDLIEKMISENETVANSKMKQVYEILIKRRKESIFPKIASAKLFNPRELRYIL